ncbi:MAG: coproporphyrinogen III oxidase [Propionibacteriaceae bacterium]|nr:coproporphyrinogen III oxidase [Propionibacteriaceae bacterium]
MPSTPPEGIEAPLDGRLPDSALATLGTRGFSLYVHVPFCATRCGYCDFNTYTAAELGAAPGSSQDAYLAAAVAELDLAVRVLGDPPPVRTVFFGGGTPTMLPAASLTGLLDAIRDRFELAEDAEITTEANPESVDAGYLDALVAAGFNRLSLGMQSARPSVLAVLERRHTPGRVAEVVTAARSAGFGSINLDLIYGSPGETASDWRESLTTALELAPEHVSAYSLIVEDGTRLARRIRRGELPAPDDDLHAELYQLAEQLLTSAGLENYEISNWALPGQECQHNLAYWLGDDWWGVGPGAHSHAGGIRWWNVRHPREYSGRLAAGSSPAQAREVLTKSQHHAERVLLELRLSRGLPLAELSPSERARADAFVADGLARADSAVLRLTPAGRLLADRVVTDLVEL